MKDIETQYFVTYQDATNWVFCDLELDNVMQNVYGTLYWPENNPIGSIEGIVDHGIHKWKAMRY